MKNILIKTDSTIQDTLIKLQSSSLKCLIVVNDKNVLLGTINDGDIRRAILKNAKVNFKISKYYKKKCFYIREKQLLKINTSEKLKKLDINIIPIVDKNKKVINYISGKIKSKKKIKNIKNYETVIMAGGYGTRLKPYTNILPKPLLPYNNKTIIENVINKFTDYGLKKFIISLNYKNILIKSFFKELSPKYKISYLEENKPLGTAGILHELCKKNKKYIISNCDIILEVDYGDLLKFHDSKKYDITIVASLQKDRIPYGVCKIQNNQLQNIIEKPEKNYIANTGLYVVHSKVFKLIKKNENTSFVELINKALKKKMSVGVYPVPSNAWLDFGQSIDFLRTN